MDVNAWIMHGYENAWMVAWIMHGYENAWMVAWIMHGYILVGNKMANIA